MEEYELELIAGDILARKRTIADAIDNEGEQYEYGPLTIKTEDGKMLSEDIDGYRFGPVDIPSGSMEDKVEELVGELDEAVEEMYNRL